MDIDTSDNDNNDNLCNNDNNDNHDNNDTNENNDNHDNNNNEGTFIIQGNRQFIVTLADNTKREAEDDERSSIRSRSHFSIPNKVNYHRIRGNFPYRWRRNSYYNNFIRRQHGLWFGRGRNVIIIRNLAKEITNSDVKSIFDKIGPIRRCGIKWNRLRGTKDIAEVEYVYSSDAFKAYRKLDYKSIKGVPIRIEIKDMPKKLLLDRREYLRPRAPYMDYRNYYNRMETIMARKRFFHHQNNMRFLRERQKCRTARYIN